MELKTELAGNSEKGQRRSWYLMIRVWQGREDPAGWLIGRQGLGCRRAWV